VEEDGRAKVGISQDDVKGEAARFTSEGRIRNVAPRTRDTAVSTAAVACMDHTKRLYLIDEFDKEYQRVQHPSLSSQKREAPCNSTTCSPAKSSTIIKRLVNTWPNDMII